MLYGHLFMTDGSRRIAKVKSRKNAGFKRNYFDHKSRAMAYLWLL
jgi:hypothetical protein